VVQMNHMLNALLVDDEESVLIVHKKILSKFDFRFDYAHDNESAFRILNCISMQNHYLDLIITDVNRPYGDGVEFIRMVRNLSDDYTIAGGLRLRHVPIIIISGAARNRLDEIAEIDAKIRLIDKLCTPENFIRTVYEVIRDYRYRLLSDLQRIGIAVVWSEGRYKLLDAYLNLDTWKAAILLVTLCLSLHYILGWC
jgi:CheY-like chemotaxis protein